MPGICQVGSPSASQFDLQGERARPCSAVGRYRDADAVCRGDAETVIAVTEKNRGDLSIPVRGRRTVSGLSTSKRRRLGSSVGA
jgi:hypothetical protein